MKKYQFITLHWQLLSDQEAKTASEWYKGPGWYCSPVDKKGKKLQVQCVAKSEPANYHAGLLEALNACGAEGWSVAAFVAAPSEGLATKIMQGIVGGSPNGPYFILQRRAA